MKKAIDLPWFLFLLPFYFFLFGISNEGMHPTSAHLLLPFVVLSGISFLLYFLFKQKKENASTYYLTFFLWLGFYLFFGNIKDAIGEGKLLYSYFTLVPLLLAIPLLFFFLIRRKSNVVKQLFSYFNILIFVLVGMQLILSMKAIQRSFKQYTNDIPFIEVKSKNLPSIYMVLFDEYPGQISLQHYYQFDNNRLVDHLRRNDFYVFDTINSNYDKTVFSVNSTLNMQLLDMAKFGPLNKTSSYMKNFVSIRNNQLCKFLVAQGYEIKNQSLFSISNHETIRSFPLLFNTNSILMRNTFFERLKRDLLWKLYCGKYRMDYFYQRYLLATHHQNNDIIQTTIQESAKKHAKPIFHFSHLLMPHEPTFTDSAGHLHDMEFVTHISDTSNMSLEYLKYTNTRMMELADSLVKHDPTAIIILMSDHGIRDTPIENQPYYCNNFMAVHLPNGDYTSLQKMRSNVNLFRILLNTYFDQQLPILNDSCISIKEDASSFQYIKPF